MDIEQQLQSEALLFESEALMPNKHFCQGPTCHERTTTDRFLKSRGVIRGRMHMQQ
jgi:hypothetical protein